MKTKIITLESHDDLISVRDKLSWAKTPRILLVWPKYEKVSLRLLDLKVLQRHADSLGAQLGLVTRRMNVRRDAESLGIPVFKTTSAAQKDVWADPAPRVQRTPKPPRRDLRTLRDEVIVKESAWRTSLLGRVAAFTAGVMAVLVLAGLFVPRAAVKLSPEAQTVSVNIPVNANPNVSSVSLSGEIPAQIITFTIDGEKTVPASSRISVPQNKATGVAQFTNLGADEILIPAGTVVETNTLVRFTTVNGTRLPGGVDEIVEVRIEAVNAGELGNVETGDITLIEGTLGLSAKVSNPEPTHGGTDSVVFGATEEDRTLLREQLLNELRTQAETQARAGLNAGDLLILDTLQVNEVLREEFTPPAGEAGNALTLALQVEFSAHTVLAEDLRSLASASVMAFIPQGFAPDGDMTFTPRAKPITDSTGVTRFELQASQSVLRSVDLMQAYNLIRGRNVQIAAAELRSTFGLQNEPQIVITPSWWTHLPLIPFNISMEVGR